MQKNSILLGDKPGIGSQMRQSPEIGQSQTVIGGKREHTQTGTTILMANEKHEQSKSSYNGAFMVETNLNNTKAALYEGEDALHQQSSA
jgi:hypothetical protein